MEFINQFIRLSIKKNAGQNRSFGVTTQHELGICLAFTLSASDCLFDLAGRNYELHISIEKPYLEKYNEPLLMDVGQQPICCHTQAKLLELIDCKLQGIQRKIFMESVVLFLLYKSPKRNTAFQQRCASCVTLDKSVMDKIQEAKKYILENLSSNLTIPAISMNVGTNRCYLKKGFKHVFQQTVFEFIQENRMMKAKHLLQMPFANVTEIAYGVGYSSLSSFSQSYKNYFGITPTEQIRQTFSNN